MENKKSIGVTILGWIYIAEACFTVIPSFFILRNIDLKGYSTIPPELSMITIIIEIVLAITGLVGGVGILKLFNWARKVLIAVAAVNILSLLSVPIVISSLTFQKFLWQSGFTVVISQRFALLFFIATIYYLTRPSVREQFK